MNLFALAEDNVNNIAVRFLCRDVACLTDYLAGNSLVGLFAGASRRANAVWQRAFGSLLHGRADSVRKNICRRDVAFPIGDGPRSRRPTTRGSLPTFHAPRQACGRASVE